MIRQARIAAGNSRPAAMANCCRQAAGAVTASDLTIFQKAAGMALPPAGTDRRHCHLRRPRNRVAPIARAPIPSDPRRQLPQGPTLHFRRPEAKAAGGNQRSRAHRAPCRWLGLRAGHGACRKLARARRCHRIHLRRGTPGALPLSDFVREGADLPLSAKCGASARDGSGTAPSALAGAIAAQCPEQAAQSRRIARASSRARSTNTLKAAGGFRRLG